MYQETLGILILRGRVGKLNRSNGFFWWSRSKPETLRNARGLVLPHHRHRCSEGEERGAAQVGVIGILPRGAAADGGFAGDLKADVVAEPDSDVGPEGKGGAGPCARGTRGDEQARASGKAHFDRVTAADRDVAADARGRKDDETRVESNVGSEFESAREAVRIAHVTAAALELVAVVSVDASLKIGFGKTTPERQAMVAGRLELGRLNLDLGLLALRRRSVTTVTSSARRGECWQSTIRS